jgi:DNA replication protein DnaC
MTESSNKPNDVGLSKQVIKTVFTESLKHNLFRFPPRFKDKTLRNFIGFEDKVKTAIQALLNGESLFITGGCGTGKTHLACGLAYLYYFENISLDPEYPEKYKYPEPPVFLPSIEFFLELKESFDQNYSSENQILSKYASFKFLVLDDVGAEKISDWSRQMFYALIDRRYRSLRQTIITSNLSLEQLSKTIDDRIASRIVEMGPIIHLGNADHRLASQKEREKAIPGGKQNSAT